MASAESFTITLEIDKAAALVLFELLARFEEGDEFTIEDSAEIYALWYLQGALERRIVESLSPDYDERLAVARAELRSRCGDAKR